LFSGSYKIKAVITSSQCRCPGWALHLRAWGSCQRGRQRLRAALDPHQFVGYVGACADFEKKRGLSSLLYKQKLLVC